MLHHERKVYKRRRFLLRYLKKYWKLVVLIFLLVLIHSLLSVKTQFLKGEILDTAVLGNTQNLFPIIAWFVALIVLGMATHQLYVMVRVRVVARIVRDIKNQIFASCLNRSLSQVEAVDRSAVIARYTNDLGMVEAHMLTMGSRLFEFVMTILTAGTALFLVSYKVGLLTVVTFLIPMFITNALKSSITAAEEGYVTTNQTHTAKLMKLLGGLEAIKNYSIEREIDAIYGTSLDELTRSDIRRSFKRSLANGMSFFATMLSQCAVLIYATILLYQGEIGVGSFVTIFSLVSILRPPFYWISQLYEGLIASFPALRSILSFIDEAQRSAEAPSASDTSQALSVTHTDAAIPGDSGVEPGGVVVRNLCFSYDESRDNENDANSGAQPSEQLSANPGSHSDIHPNMHPNVNPYIIDHLSFEVRPGEKVLITGESGSGKSTLIKLLTGILLPTAGSIELGGEFSYFMQDAFLFQGTLRDNLTLYDDRISDAEIARVSKLCGISDLLEEERAVAERGSNLSGGEKKRVSLARAMLYNKKILILDEPLANIDTENIERIERAIIEDKEHTILMISHICSEELRSSMNQVISLERTHL